MAQELAAGVEITLRGNTLIIPPLNIRSIKECTAHIMAIDDPEISFADKMDQMMIVILKAIRRNYPDETLLTDDYLYDNIDLSNITDIFSAVLNQTGLNKKKAMMENQEQV